MTTSSKDKISISDILTRSLQVCNDVRHVVDSSSELLYLIDLRYFSAIPVPGPDRTVSSLQRSLQQSQFAWQKAEYFKGNPTPMPFIPLGTFIWSRVVLGFQVTAQLREHHFFSPSWQTLIIPIAKTRVNGFAKSIVQSHTTIFYPRKIC